MKASAYIATSLDGFIARANGDIDFLTIGDSEENEEDYGYKDFINSVDALVMENEAPVVDSSWCIGCGVCATVCATDAVSMVLRPDRTKELPAKTVKELHQKILEEKHAV